MSKVGLIGVGAMGKGVLKNLIKNNCEVIAYDVTEKGRANIQDFGGQIASHPIEVAQATDIIFLSLPNPQIIKELFLGVEGIINELKSNTTVLDLSTIDPATTIELNELCQQHNSYYFDCPVSGGPAGAEMGTLTIMVGGDKNQFNSIFEYLSYIGSNIEYIGESGLAQTLKLCHNMVGAANIAALGEAFATGVKHGLSVQVIADVVGKSLASSNNLEYFGPNIINGTYENVKFMLSHMHKDLSLYVSMTHKVNVPSFIGATTYNLYDIAKTHNKGLLDHSAVCQVYEEFASVRLTQNNHIRAILEGSIDKTAEPGKKVGLIGVGAMGRGVLKNLIKNNCDVIAYDVSESGQADIEKLGGVVARHPKEVAQSSDIIFLSLPNPQVIKELIMGTDGIINELKEKTTIFDLSTIDPTTTRELNELCKQYDSYYFDCPVSGGPAGADAGTLTIMVGGDKDHYLKVAKYLGYIGANIEFIGDSGLAQALKLCHNMIGAASIVALGEAFVTGVKSGLNVKVIADVIGKSLGNSRMLQYFGPNIINNTYENVKFMLNHMHKDLQLYVKMTQDVGVPSFIGSSTYNLYHIAKTQNKGLLDHTAVCQVIEDMAKVKLVESELMNESRR